MKWFYRWLGGRIQRSIEDHGSCVIEKEPQYPKISTASDRGLDSRAGIGMSVYKASGGFIIEYRTWDERQDRWNQKLHIVTEGQDLGGELGKIITVETLRY